MPRPTTSPEGPREQFSTTLTKCQRDLLGRARAAGYSKQRVITEGVLLLDISNDLPQKNSEEGGRKTVRFRCAPEVLRYLREVCGRNPDGTKIDKGGDFPTYGQVVEAAAKKLLGE